MADLYDLTRMVEQIIEDEKATAPKTRHVTQEDIRQMLMEGRRRSTNPLDSSRLPLEHALLEAGLITRDQLEKAREVQSDNGGKIGAILLELGFISDEDLLDFLGKQYGIQIADLLDMDIGDDVLYMLPSRVMIKHRVLPLQVQGRVLSLAMESPNDVVAIQEVELMTGKTVKPVIIPSYQMRLTIKCIEERGEEILTGLEIHRALKGAMTMQTLLEHLVLSKGTDILITAGAPPSIKVANTLKRANVPPLTRIQCEACAKILMTRRQWDLLMQRRDIDFSIDYEDKGRFRVNAYIQKNSISLVIRRIMDLVPTFESLGLPEWLEEFLLKPQGLIVIGAPIGQGKTTSLAAMVDFINRKRRCNIITIEDPIEYVHASKESNINQRELGSDTDSFADGVLKALRQSPDVLVVSEIRDHEALGAAMTAASTGHLVLTTMLASTTTDAIEKMIGFFPASLQTKASQQLAEVLLLVIAQKLVPCGRSDSLILAYEKLLNSYRIKAYIRENDIGQIRAQFHIETDDFVSIDGALVKLVEERKINMEDALLYADDTYYIIKQCI